MRYDGKQGCSVNYILLRTLNNGKLANNNMEVMDNTTTANTITTHDYSDLSTPHCTYAYIHTHKSTQTHTFAHFSFCFGTHTLALLSHFDMLVRVSVEREKSKPARSSRCVWVCMCARVCVCVSFISLPLGGWYKGVLRLARRITHFLLYQNHKL